MNNEIKPVNIGGVMVGDNYPTVFMAEIGTFFNKDISLAQQYIKSAIKSRVQIIKTELLHTPDICIKGTGLTHKYKHATGEYIEDYRELIERKVVSLDDYLKIFKLCQSLDCQIVCSVYDTEGIDFLTAQGGAAIKLSRDNINNIALINYAATTGLPIIFDAGNVYLHEIALAIETARNAGASEIIVNIHPGQNPAPPEAHNLKMVETLKNVFNIPVGLSCHYKGDEILYVAIGAGINLIEKGVVDNPDRVEQDLVSAAGLDEVELITKKMNNCWLALGNNSIEVKEPRDCSSWKCIVSKNKIKKGDMLKIENISFAFPPVGISVGYWNLIKDKKAAKDIKQNEVIKWEDIEFNSK